MSICNFTQQVGANQCIGDSLATFNANFSALDQGLCDLPQIVPGTGTRLQPLFTEQQKHVLNVSTKNNFVYQTRFESTRYANAVTTSLLDGTSINTTRFPYSNDAATTPIGTFSTLCLTEKPPRVTFYYTASGVDNTTVYALNSSVSENFEGPLCFDNSVNAIINDGNTLYVGGAFNRVGSTFQSRFCQITLNEGSVHPVLSSTGALSSNNLFTTTGLGQKGSVDVIALSGNLVAIGGTFEGIKGRSLSIANKSTGVTYPFYVDGSVNALHFAQGCLFVGGAFDFVNYNFTKASIYSGQRIKSNGLFKIDLGKLVNGFGVASIKDVSSVFSGPAQINAITSYGTKIFLGGNFQVKSNSYIECQNLCLIDSSGIRAGYWNPIISGPVHCLIVNDTTLLNGVYLYVGGAFNKCYSKEEYFSEIGSRIDNADNTFYNAVCYNIDVESLTTQILWKPKFDGPVTAFCLQNNLSNSQIYCYGKFLTVNNFDRSYLACVEKVNAGNGSLVQTWAPRLERGPMTVNNGLLKFADKIIVGGNFENINNSPRYNLAMINDVESSLYTTPLSSVTFQFGGQVCSSGNDYNLNFANNQSISVYPAPYGNISSFTFEVDPQTFKGNTEGQLARFFVTRPGQTSETFGKDIDIVGWKIDFNG